MLICAPRRRWLAWGVLLGGGESGILLSMSTTQSDSIVDVVPPTVIVTPPAEATIAPRITLHSGDVMSRTEFHDRYEHTAKGFKAELIDGVVFVASPVQLKHSRPDNLFHGLLAFYEARTPGVESAANATVLLGPSDEVQPDSLLRVRPNYGGRSKPATEATGDYVVGPPELVVEIANTSRSIDLHKKRDV